MDAAMKAMLDRIEAKQDAFFVRLDVKLDKTDASIKALSDELNAPPKGGHPGGLYAQVDATHATSQGTSMSSPMVAGVAAMLLQQDPTLTQDQVRALLQVTGNKP